MLHPQSSVPRVFFNLDHVGVASMHFNGPLTLKLSTAICIVVLFLGLLEPSAHGASAFDRAGTAETGGEGTTHRLFLPLVCRRALVYHDDFSDPNSGWYVGAALRQNDFCDWIDAVSGCSGLQEVAYMSYANDNYRFYIPLTWHGGGKVDTWFVWPVQAAPLPAAFYPLPTHYCLEARGRFSSYEGVDYQPWWAHWGIVFGADEDLSELYTFQVNANHDMAVLRYENYTYPGNRQPMDGSKVNVESALVAWSGDMKDLMPTHRYNTLKVVVRGELADVYINGRHMDSISIRRMPRARVGLIGGSWEVTPVQIDVDYFRYTPDCDS